MSSCYLPLDKSILRGGQLGNCRFVDSALQNVLETLIITTALSFGRFLSLA